VHNKIVFLSFALTTLFSTVLNIQFKTSLSYVGSRESPTSQESQVIALVNGTAAYNYDLEMEQIALRHYAFRAGGSAGANETANWIEEHFEGLGLESWLEHFEFTTWDLLSRPSLIIDEDGDQGTTSDQTVIPSFQCEHYSWPTPSNGAFADLVILPLPKATSYTEIRNNPNPINMTAWNAIDTTGKIVLIGREVRWVTPNWMNTFFDKLSKQPPVAVVYTWWYSWMAFTPPMYSSIGGHIYWSSKLPAGFVNYGDGLWIRNRENALNVSACVSVRSIIGTGVHYNVVGRIRGYENPEKLVIISGHYDTVMCGGFCDNGAGTAGVVELARVFADAVDRGLYKPGYTLLFVAFASEELWLVGSINYVKQHKSEMANVSAVINLDCIGSDEFCVTETNSVNGFDLDQVVLDAAQDLGITATVEKPDGSDHKTFQNPSGTDGLYYSTWGLQAGISDAEPVQSSTMLISYPLLYDDKWNRGSSGWIHTSYDNSTSTEPPLNWVEPHDLEDQIRVAALSALRVSSSSQDVGQTSPFPWWTVGVVIAVAVVAVTVVYFVMVRKPPVKDVVQ